MKDYLSVRGRLGYAWDRFLLFGTAGWAWGNPSTAYGGVGDAPLFINGGNTLASGWTAGVGLEYAFTDHVLGRLEYRYTDLADIRLRQHRNRHGRCWGPPPDQRFPRRHRL